MVVSCFLTTEGNLCLLGGDHKTQLAYLEIMIQPIITILQYFNAETPTPEMLSRDNMIKGGSGEVWAEISHQVWSKGEREINISS